MLIPTALKLIQSIVYKPCWRFEVEDHSRRFEDTILVTIYYPARNSDRDQAPQYSRPIEARASFPIIVGDVRSSIELDYRILQCIVAIETHEAREFYRRGLTMWAPFHPHRIDGMERWQRQTPYDPPTADLMFGIA